MTTPLEKLDGICRDLGIPVGKATTSDVLIAYADRLSPIQRGLVEVAKTLPEGAVTWSIVDDARRRVQDAMVELNTEGWALRRGGE